MHYISFKTYLEQEPLQNIHVSNMAAFFKKWHVFFPLTTDKSITANEIDNTSWSGCFLHPIVSYPNTHITATYRFMATTTLITIVM